MRTTATKSIEYQRIGYLPELRYCILKNNDTGKLELWTPSRGLAKTAIEFQGVELEFIRQAQAYRVIDDEYNRKNYPDEIGRIYIDRAPTYVSVKEL